MPRSQINFFLTPRQVGEVLREVCAQLDAAIVAIVQDPDFRGFQIIDPQSAPDFLSSHKTGSIFVTTAPVPDLAERFQRTNQDIVIVLGGADEEKRELSASVALGTPNTPAEVVFKAFVKAVIHRCNKGVIDRDYARGKVLPWYWEKSLTDWSFPDFEAVLPGEQPGKKPKKASASAKRKKASRTPSAFNSEGAAVTLRKKGKYSYGDNLDALRAEMLRYSRKNGYEISVFWQPLCGCDKESEDPAEDGERFALEYNDDEGAAWLACSDCGTSRPLADSAQHEATSNAGCYCELDEECGQVLVGAATFTGSDDLRWIYVGWRAPRCGLVGVYVDWKCDGSMKWPELEQLWKRADLG